MGKPVVSLAVQAAADEHPLQHQEQPGHCEKDQAQGARDAYSGSDVARRSYGSCREEDSRKGDEDGARKGEARRGVRGHSDVPQVQVEEDQLLSDADSQRRRGEFPPFLVCFFKTKTDYSSTARDKLLQLPMRSPMAFLLSTSTSCHYSRIH